ncbi:MAG: response regulator [Myxococcaceae bacterium]|nr:response regulator [Myxococcaceae bacterium]
MPDELEAVRLENLTLRREVATLAEQLKLLVKAEHALTRTRRAQERQLERIETFAEFAFDIAGVEQASGILDRARLTLLEQFELDDVVMLGVDAVEPRLRAGENVVPIERGLWQVLLATSTPGIVPGEDPGSAPLLAALAAVGRAPHWVRTLMWVPIQPRSAPESTLAVGWSLRPNSNHRDVPRPEHQPYLALFGGHVTRALVSAQLTTELRRQSTALAQSNQQLKASLGQLEATQAQLLQAQKLEAIGRLAGGIAHDFNNLLTVIGSHAELVRPAVDHDPEAQEDLGIILEATRRATDITKRLLAFGRKQERREQSVDVNAAATDLSRVLRRLIGDDIQLQLDLDPGLGHARVDAVHLEQILMNLVVNARDAMPRGGRLNIETRRAVEADRANLVPVSTAGLIAISVRDTGTGMDEATRRQLFEPFFTTKPAGKGTGLGLATVYGLLQQNHGEVSVRSEVGKGSCFTVLLPSFEGASAARASEAPPPTRGTALVAEDEDLIRRMLARTLRKRGFEVLEARDGVQALDAAIARPDLTLLVTDVMMPELGGAQLAQRLRKLRPDLPIVFTSGHTFDQLDIGRLDPRLDRFLPKPFTPDEVEAAVTAVLGR